MNKQEKSDPQGNTMNSHLQEVKIIMPHKNNHLYVYLRNKETQQTLRVIVNIIYDASF